MPNHPLLTVGIEMPADFPVKPYEAIYNRLASKQDTHFDSWYEFIRAWDAIAYRFRSCAEHDKASTRSIRQAGKGPPPPERYIQERELFCFFVSGLATIESLCYSLFAIGSILDVRTFPFTIPKDKRNVSPEETAPRFKAAFPNEKITATLQRMTKTQDYQDWKAIRNILSHRSVLSRQFFVGGDRDGIVLWGKVPIDENTTVSRRRWLEKMISDLLDAADIFTAARFL